MCGRSVGDLQHCRGLNIALLIQPQILTLLSLLTWAQCKHCGSKWPRDKTAFVAVPIAAILAALEWGLVYGIGKARKNNVHWPAVLVAVLSACLLCAGVLRHYWDIYMERTVRGISFIFVALDALGDLTSLASIFFQPRLDVLGMVMYGSELFLWCGIMSCGGQILQPVALGSAQVL